MINRKNATAVLKFFFKWLMFALLLTSAFQEAQSAPPPNNGAIFAIVPNTSTATVTASGTTMVSYTVTLASTVTQAITNIGVDAGFNMPSTLVRTTLQSDTCSGQTLSPSSRTCTFAVAMQGVSGKTGNTTLMPRVSGGSGTLRSVPTENNRVAVRVTNNALVTLTSITLTPASPTIQITGTQQFTATGHYSDSTTADITSSVAWASSSTGVAMITASGGLATGISGGITSITASLNGVTSSPDVLTVAAVALVSITITPASPTANIPGTQNITPTQLTATGAYADNTTADITNSVTWSSSNTAYATVTTNGSTRGQVTGVSVPAGSTMTSVTITATDPTTSLTATQAVAVNLVVGSSYNQGYVYCLGTGSGSGNCAFLPSVNCPSGLACVGEVTNNVDATKAWWNGSYTTTNATSTTDGQANTTAIIASQGDPTGTGYAANYCKNYNSGDAEGNWYLPAKDELNVIYGNKTTLNTAGANLSTNSYWSSTEKDLYTAWAQFFLNGIQYSYGKLFNDESERCVRVMWLHLSGQFKYHIKNCKESKSESIKKFRNPLFSRV